MGKQPMAFYHDKGLVPTWHLAQQYIKDGGRLATLPDIIDARLATEPGTVPWETWFTTLSAEYVGIGRSGRKIIIVAHGVGPMATLDGIMEAYRHEFADKDRNNRGGRISIEEFHKLEDGVYGEVIRVDDYGNNERAGLSYTATAPVYIVDYESYVSQYQYPFISYLRFFWALIDDLLFARFGGKRRAQKLVDWHKLYAEKWHDEQRVIKPEDRYGLEEAMGTRDYGAFLSRRQAAHLSDRDNPFLVQLGDASNCPYQYHTIEEGTALAHLLSIGRLANVHHDGHESLAYEASAHEWWNGCRFVGIPDGVEMTTIHPGWDPWRLMAEHWEQLMVPLPRRSRIGIRPLTKLGDNWFTQYPSKGHSMATGEPEFKVTEMEQLGDPVEFLTEIHGYYGFFRYDVQDVKAVAPPNANGFVVGEPEIVYTKKEYRTTLADGTVDATTGDDATHHKAMVTFYRIKADTSRRLRQRKDIAGDYETQMKLLAPV